MRNPTYLQLSRRGIYYLRLPIPKRLHPSHLPSTLKISLRTRDPQEALRLSRSLGHMMDETVIAKLVDGMRYDEIRKLLKEHFQKSLTARIESINHSGRLSGQERSILASSLMLAESAIKENTSLLDLNNEHRDEIHRFASAYGIDISRSQNLYELLKSEMPKSYRDYIQSIIKYDESLERYDYSDDTTRPEPSKSSLSSGMTIGQLAQSYEHEKRAGRLWVAKTEQEKSEHIALLTEILGIDTNASSLTATDAKKVKDTLFQYPKNRSKNPTTRGKSLDEVVRIQNVERIQIPTINKYLQTYNDMFQWAKRNGHIEENRFSGLNVRQNKKQGDGKRSSFSNAEIRSIVDAVTTSDVSFVRKPYQKWGTLIGIYTGARLNEIAQMHLTDIREQNGIWFFDLNDDDDSKHLKADASRRPVPIHDQLIEFGIIPYVQELRQSGAKKLFPEFTYCTKNGWGRSLGRWFNEQLMPKLGMKRKELVFHSLRHTVVTRLLQSDVPLPMVRAIVGHKQEGVTHNNYFKSGYKIEQLKITIDQLHFNDQMP